MADGLIHKLRRIFLSGAGSCRHLSTILDTASDGIAMFDGTGRVLVFNPACARIFGYSAKQIVGGNLRALLPPGGDGVTDTPPDAELLADMAGDTARILVLQGQRSDGKTFPMEMSLARSEVEGQPVFVAIIRDLGGQEKLEATNAARLRAVIDTAVDGVILADVTGKIQMVNPAVERLFGHPADAVISRNVKILMPPSYADAHDGYLEHYLRTGEKRIIGSGREVTGQRANGSTFPMTLSVGEMREDGERGFVGIIHDLSDMKASERKLVQAQKIEAVGQIAGGVSHDFNNLLTVILGNMELMKELVDLDREALELLDAVTTAAERGGQLTRRLLAFSRRQTLRPEALDLNALLDNMELLLRKTLRADIDFRFDTTPSLPRTIVDHAQLEAAIVNLVVNARDAMPVAGSLTIATSEVALDEAYRGTSPEILPGSYVLVAVTDTGAGMSRDVLERVFEPFYTTKEVGQGSGLGLPMVYGFVKQSRGHVTIYSEPGLGTTVRLYLPVAPTDALELAEDAAPFIRPSPEGAPLVMVVEDDELVRSHFLSSLRVLGYRSVAYSNGDEAIDAIANGIRPALLLSDMIMPGNLTGLDTALKAREMLPDLRVLLTSGYPRDALIEQGRITSDMQLLDKPFRLATLREHIIRALEAPPQRLRQPSAISAT